MSPSHGKFVGYELITSDTEAAGKFYHDVLGWRSRNSGTPNMTYFLLSADGSDVAGLMELPEHVRAGGGRPAWLGYVAVDDVDASAAQARTLGGSVHRAPEDIPGVGRFAVIADPDGAVLCLITPKGEPPANPVPPGTPGHAGWRELHAGDREAAFVFYSTMFGWTKGDGIDMGPIGIYQIFGRAGETMVGGMMTKVEAVPMPFWLYYINVADIDDAAAKVTSADGTIVNGPHQVPGGAWIVQGLDPQGAMFALVGPRA
jgi:predicted enzyme related to lactoylglutathione lyase